MLGFYKNYIDILETIDDAFKKRRIIPGLILLYSTIDSFSSLSNIGNQTRRKVFMDWVEQWMLNKYPLPCDKEDIYSARCGLLHQHMSESDMTIRKVARHVHYVWGSNDGKFLQDLYDKSAPGLNVVVRIEDLAYSFKGGMLDCWEAIKEEKDWLNLVNKKADKLFITVRNTNK